MNTDRESAIDAVDVLNDLVGDLSAGTNVFRDYRDRLKSGSFSVVQMSAVQKMCFSHLALAFSKLLEFWQHYHDLVPDIHRDDLKRLNAELQNRGAKTFRNKVAGHIWDKKHQRPLRNSEIMLMLEGLIGSRADDFLNWINDVENNIYPKTILSIIETIRDSMVQEYSIVPSEFLER